MAPLKLLLVEDSVARVERFRLWAPADVAVVWVHSASRAIALLTAAGGRTYDGLLLDHDLDGRLGPNDDGSLTGQHVVTAVLSCVDSDVPVFVHSGNVDEAKRMAARLREAGFETEQVPVPLIDERRFLDWLDVVREARAAATRE